MSFRMSQKEYSYCNNVVKMQCYRISLSKLDSGVVQLSVQEPGMARVLFKIYYYCCELILFYFFGKYL